MRNKFYYDVVKTIKDRLPLDHPIHVRRVATPQGICGDCYYDKSKKIFVIRIDRKLPQYYAVDVFIHEYAHAISWKIDKREDHGKAWGIAYALVYRALLDYWYLEDSRKVAKFKLQ